MFEENSTATLLSNKRDNLRVSMYVWMMMTMKGTRRLKNNQMSIIFK